MVIVGLLLNYRQAVRYCDFQLASAFFFSDRNHNLINSSLREWKYAFWNKLLEIFSDSKARFPGWSTFNGLWSCTALNCNRNRSGYCSNSRWYRCRLLPQTCIACCCSTYTVSHQWGNPLYALNFVFVTKISPIWLWNSVFWFCFRELWWLRAVTTWFIYGTLGKRYAAT